MGDVTLREGRAGRHRSGSWGGPPRGDPDLFTRADGSYVPEVWQVQVTFGQADWEVGTRSVVKEGQGLAREKMDGRRGMD